MTHLDYDKLRKPNKTVWLTKCRLCPAITSKGFYCHKHKKKSTMNKFEWYCKYGLDREMKNFSPKLYKETSCNQFELKTLD